MSLNKKQKSILIVYIIIFLVFNLLFFIIPFRKTASIMVMYGFSLVSILLGYGIIYYAFKGSETLKSKVYGFPILRISCIYTVSQLALTGIFCIINSFVNVPVWITLVICILLLAFMLIGTIAADNARDIVTEVENKIEQKTRKIRTFKLDIAGLADSCSDREAKKLLEKLSDKLRYSDPVSSEALEDAERRISQGIEEITQMLDSNNYADLPDKIRMVDRLVDDRNRRCKAEKINA